MKQVLIIVGLLLIIGLGIFLGEKYWGNSSSQVKGAISYSADSPDAPKIDLPEKTHDFGKINITDTASYPFKIKNNGKNPLVVTTITTSCHCTTAILKVPGQPDSPEFSMHSMGDWQGEIAPGVEASLEVIYRPSVMPVKGQINRIIYLETNDPNNKNSKLEINAEVL